MEETVIDVPVWVILSVLAASSVATLCIVVLNYKRQSRYRSSQIISAMVENTSKYNDAIVNLSNGKTLTKIDKYGLSRIVYYMEILAQCRKDKLVDDDYVNLVYYEVLYGVTDEKICEIFPNVTMDFLRRPDVKLYLNFRTMRDEIRKTWKDPEQ